MLKGAVLCFITLISTTKCFYAPMQCPQTCLCLQNFTDCKDGNFSTLPKGLDPNVSVLDLAYNNFQVFPKELNRYPGLVHLNLSHNNIQGLGVLTSIKLPNLERLDLTYNSFRDWMDIRSTAFASTKKLLFLDLSHNPLSSVPREKNPLQISSLKILRLNNCSIAYLNNKILDNLPNLEELHLADNPIQYLQANFISQSLKFLDLSRCKLEIISPSVFRGLTSLETLYMQQNLNLKKFNCDSRSLLYLDLSDCNLEVIPSGDLPNVYKANFHGNHFRIVPKHSFANYTNLEYLDLSYNAISMIESDGFSGLLNIQIIDLSKNTLSDFDRTLFETNRNLKFLNLSRNYFSKVENMISDSLEVLDLSVCEIYLVDFDSLVEMPSLKTLNLSKNIISLLPDNWQSENLMSLDVSLCRIKSINNRTFNSMPSLRHVSLAGNRLTTASPDAFGQVISLDIVDNPWRCDCPSLKGLYTWLSKTGKRTEGLYCQSPEKFEGMSWSSACYKEWYPESTRNDSVWWYTTGLIVTVFVILFIILAMRRMYLLKEKRIREADQARRAEERETLRRMQRMQSEAREEVSRNAPDPRELQGPPSYTEALLLPRLDSSHPSLSGSLHSIASKHSIHGSLTDVSKRNRHRRKRRRRKSDSSEGQRASRVVVDSDTNTDPELPQPRATLQSDF